MKQLNYSVTINAATPVVFANITDNTLFPEWAKAWGDGMQCVGEWKEGESLYFTDATGQGTKAVVEELAPNERIKMRHTAMVTDGDKEIVDMDETMQKWIGALEEYYFTSESDGSTTLKVTIVANEAFEEMMQARDNGTPYDKDI